MIDANIILDVLMERQPHCKTSSLIWKLCETDLAEGYVSTLTIANLIYVMRKELSPDQTAVIIRQLKLIFHIADFTSQDLSRAANMEWNDFEDAVQSAIAERIHADRIITRNIRDFVFSKVPAMTPAQYLDRLQF